MEIVSSELKVIESKKNIIKAGELDVTDPENAEDILKANIIEDKNGRDKTKIKN